MGGVTMPGCDMGWDYLSATHILEFGFGKRI